MYELYHNLSKNSFCIVDQIISIKDYSSFKDIAGKMTHWNLSFWRRIQIPLFYHCHLLAWHSLSLATELFSHQERRFFGTDLMTVFFFLWHCSPFYRHFCTTLSSAMLLEGPLPHDSMDMTSHSINFVSSWAHSAGEKLVRTVLKADWNMKNAEFTDLSPLPWRVRSDWALLNTKNYQKRTVCPTWKGVFFITSLSKTSVK